jgi:hypothetical protein
VERISKRSRAVTPSSFSAYGVFVFTEGGECTRRMMVKQGLRRGFTWSLKAVTQVLPLSSMIDMFTM